VIAPYAGPRGVIMIRIVESDYLRV